MMDAQNKQLESETSSSHETCEYIQLISYSEVPMMTGELTYLENPTKNTKNDEQIPATPNQLTNGNGDQQIPSAEEPIPIVRKSNAELLNAFLSKHKNEQIMQQIHTESVKNEKTKEKNRTQISVDSEYQELENRLNEMEKELAVVKFEAADWKSKYLNEAESHQQTISDVGAVENTVNTSAEESYYEHIRRMVRKLKEDSTARKAVEYAKQDLQRTIAVQDVELRQLRTKIVQTENKLRKESGKVKQLSVQLEEEAEMYVVAKNEYRTLTSECDALTAKIKDLELKLNEFENAESLVRVHDEIRHINLSVRRKDDTPIENDLKYKLETDQPFVVLHSYQEGITTPEHDREMVSQPIENAGKGHECSATQTGLLTGCDTPIKFTELLSAETNRNSFENELRDTIVRLQDDLARVESNSHKFAEQHQREVEELVKTRNELELRIANLIKDNDDQAETKTQTETNYGSSCSCLDEILLLRKQVEEESTKKQQAVNKLSEILEQRESVIRDGAAVAGKKPTIAKKPSIWKIKTSGSK